jgi:hypothetical protein
MKVGDSQNRSYRMVRLYGQHRCSEMEIRCVHVRGSQQSMCLTRVTGSQYQETHVRASKPHMGRGDVLDCILGIMLHLLVS